MESRLRGRSSDEVSTALKRAAAGDAPSATRLRRVAMSGVEIKSDSDVTIVMARLAAGSPVSLLGGGGGTETFVTRGSRTAEEGM